MVMNHISAHIEFDSDSNNDVLSMPTYSGRSNWDFVNKDLNSLIVFLLRFIGLKPKDNKKYDDEDEIIGEQIQSWMYNYSHPKFIKIWSIGLKQ